MGSMGGYFRLGVGIILCVEVLRLAMFGGGESAFATGLAVIFLASTAGFFIRKAGS